MSRTKKSRKPGASHFSPPKENRNKLDEPAPRKPKNKKGKPAGSRQQEGTKKPKQTNGPSVAKDPRLGSKKPILLTKETNKVASKTTSKKTDDSPIAAIRTIEVDNSLADELQAIEQDPRLLAILEKQDQEIALTAEEVDLFNQLMERHEEISVQLGLDEDDDAIEESEGSLDEDALWDKLDNDDLSKFE